MPRKERTPSQGMVPHADPLLSPVDVGVYLHVPTSTVYAWASRGEGPRSSKLGRHRRYRLSDVDRWVAEHQDPA